MTDTWHEQRTLPGGRVAASTGETFTAVNLAITSIALGAQ